MHLFIILLVILLVAFVVLWCFWRNFRIYINRQIAALITINSTIVPVIFRFLVRVIGIYAIAVLGLAGLALILIILGIFIPCPIFSGLAFLISIGLIILAWSPVGIIRKAWPGSRGFMTSAMKTFICWIAFAGWLSMFYPDILSLKFLMICSLIGLMSMALMTKIKIMNVVIFPLVLILSLIAAGKYLAPDNYRTISRWIHTKNDVVIMKIDQGSLENESKSSSLGAILITDITTVYQKNDKGQSIFVLSPVPQVLNQGTIVRVFNSKDCSIKYDNRNYTMVQLNAGRYKWDFTDGARFYIETDLLHFGNLRDLIEKYQLKYQLEKERSESDRKQFITDSTKQSQLPVNVTQTIGSCSETATLRKGDVWFPDHIFQKGEKVTYIVQYAALNHVADNGTTEIPVGAHTTNVIAAGKLIFEGKNYISQIKVVY